MIRPTQAMELIQTLALPKNIINIGISQAYGYILAESCIADRDFPPFDRVMMDGIAISDMSKTEWPIEGIAFAGEPCHTLKNIEGAIEIMTGAPVPNHCQAIIKIEEVDFFQKEEQKWARYNGQNPIQSNQFIHKKGIDSKKYDIILSVGDYLGPNEIALAATIGKSELSVYAKPKIAIFSTGDEIVSLDQIPLSHQIRTSNSMMMEANLAYLGYQISSFHAPDQAVILEERLVQEMKNSDILLISGGVSVGKKDFLPEVLYKLGFQSLFHKIAQKPGKPLWVGSRADGKIIFAFPGNPISTLTCFKIYFLPWLLGNIQAISEIEVAGLPQPNVNLDQWIPVEWIDNRAKAISNNGSGDLIHWKKAAGLVWQKAGQKDTRLPYFSLK